MYTDLTKPIAASMKNHEIMARYERAQHFNQGLFGKSVARNTTLFPVWIAGSNCFWYERELKDGKEFRLVDADKGTNTVAFNHQMLAEALVAATGEKADAKNLPINIPDYQTVSIININLHPLRVAFNAFNKRWEFNDETGMLDEVELVPGNWMISPNGSQAAFRRDHNIWVRDLKTGVEHALTTDGEEFYQYGIPGSVWGNDAFVSMLGLQARWSPDSKRLFTVQLDQRQVKVIGEIQHVPVDGSLRPITKQRKLAFPEDAHVETYRLLAIEVETGRTIEANYARIPTTTGADGAFFDNSLGWWATMAAHRRSWRWRGALGLDARTTKKVTVGPRRQARRHTAPSARARRRRRACGRSAPRDGDDGSVARNDEFWAASNPL